MELLSLTQREKTLSIEAPSVLQLGSLTSLENVKYIISSLENYVLLIKAIYGYANVGYNS
jgi:hypothetical protein